MGDVKGAVENYPGNSLQATRLRHRTFIGDVVGISWHDVINGQVTNANHITCNVI